MDDCRITISRLANGWSVRMTDPKIVEVNRKRDSSKGPYTPYRDPEVTMAFDTPKDVLKFLTANLEKALPTDEFETSFIKALGETAKDKD